MKLTLTKEEVLGLIHDSLCNGSMLAQCGVQLNYTEKQYKDAKARLLAKNPNKGLCTEDVFTEILNGEGKLAFYDEEGEEDLEIKLEGEGSAIERLQSEEAVEYILDMKNERDDACTASAILEICLYGEVIFG